MRNLVTLSFLIISFCPNVDLDAFGKSDKLRKTDLMEVRVHPNAKAPVLDGILSKNEWTSATVINRFTQKEPNQGAPVSEATFVLVTYDAENIYFGIRCFDKQPEKIVSYDMRRDSDLTDNDYIEIIIDSFHDQRNAYYFATNPLGARVDSEVKNEGAHINWDWDGVWHSKAQRDRFGWTAEIAIPFKTLRFDNHRKLTWGINFGRYIPRKREEAFWAPITRDDDFASVGKFKVSKFGRLYGLSNITQGRTFQVKPYGISGWQQSLNAGNSTERLTEFGLDAKVHVTSNITSDLTVNTDFAQVEADLEQVNLSRFSLFFPEKRDFFLEAHDIFNIGEESLSTLSLLFHSRRIGLHRDQETFELEQIPIVGGVKVTGKEAGFELGFLNVLTDKHEYLNGELTPVAIPRTNYSAIRIKRDLFARSYIGVMGLSKDLTSGGNSNRTYVVDGLFSLAHTTTLSGYLAKTQTPGLNGSDYSGFVNFSWGIDEASVSASYTDIGENFNPEMGFIQWAGIRKYTGEITLSPRPQVFSLRQMHFTNNVEVITDRDNQLQYRTIASSLTHTFQNDAFVFAGLTNYYDNVPSPGFYLESALIPAGIYRYNVAGVGIGSDYSRNLAATLEFGAGSFYSGSFQGLSLSGQLRPHDRFGVDLGWNWNRVDVPFEEGRFTTSILGLRTFYSFTPNLYGKTYVQWNSFDKRIVGNFLVNFIHTPGSDFYLVYNQQWDTRGGLRNTDRTLVLKATYLFSF